MDFSDYQEKAKSTAIYPKDHKIYYPALGLSAEVGELNNKIKKKMRDNKLNKEDIISEAGDVLWYLSQLMTDLDISLDQVAQYNVQKLAARKKDNKIQGSGDYR